MTERSGWTTLDFVDMVMTGMPGCFHGGERETAGGDDLSVLDGNHPFRRCRQDVSPQHLHLVLVDAGGAGDELAGIDQVRGAKRVDIDRGSLFTKRKGDTASQVATGSRYDSYSILQSLHSSLKKL